MELEITVFKKQTRLRKTNTSFLLYVECRHFYDIKVEAGLFGKGETSKSRKEDRKG